MGAIAFNFSTLQRGARLDEGANQLEALLRYARAQAAATGHRVRIQFEEDVGDGLLVPLGNLSVAWEADPLAEPDIFVPLPEASSYVDSIQNLISIEEVKVSADAFPKADAEPDAAVAAGGARRGDGADSGAPAIPGAPSASPVDEIDDPNRFGFPPITFLPDGSSDSAIITVAPRDDEGEDARRVVLRLAGLTGAIHRRVVVIENPEAPASAEAAEGKDGSGSSSVPSANPTGAQSGLREKEGQR